MDLSGRFPRTAASPQTCWTFSIWPRKRANIGHRSRHSGYRNSTRSADQRSSAKVGDEFCDDRGGRADFMDVADTFAPAYMAIAATLPSTFRLGVDTENRAMGLRWSLTT